MSRRRNIVAATLVAPFLPMFASAHARNPGDAMPGNANTAPAGPANRGLSALERSWIVTRFYSEAMMEEGRVPRDRWDKAKLNAIHGNFDIRDPDNGDLLMKVEKGVRVPPALPSAR